MSRANPSSDLSTRAASPLGLSRFQAGRKVMGIELRLSRAPGFVISKGPGRFQALSVHAMSWHLTHKVALVLAYLQAADSDCQQRGENEWEWNRSRGPTASFGKTRHLRLLRSPLSSDSLWTSRSSLQRVQEVEFTQSFLVHYVHLCSGHREILKNLMDVRPRLGVDPRNTSMTQIPSIAESRQVSHLPHAICLFFQKYIIMCRYILYFLFRTKTLKALSPRQHTKSQPKIWFECTSARSLSLMIITWHLSGSRYQAAKLIFSHCWAVPVLRA